MGIDAAEAIPSGNHCDDCNSSARISSAEPRGDAVMDSSCHTPETRLATGGVANTARTEPDRAAGRETRDQARVAGHDGPAQSSSGGAPCRLCGSPTVRFTVAARKPPARAYDTCGACGYTALDTTFFPSQAEEKARYLLHLNDAGNAGYVRWIESFADAIRPFVRPGASVLDFGSGPRPVPARVFRSRGYSVTVYDPYFAPDTTWQDRRWDAIVVHEVAEHLSDPRSILAGLAAVLEPGGVLCIRTRFAPVDGDGNLDIEAFASWWYRQDPTHLGFFTRTSISIIAASLGMKVLSLTDPDTAVLGTASVHLPAP